MLPTPPAPTGVRFLRAPETWLVAALVLATAFVRFVVRPPAVAPSFELYFQLASAFVSGVLAAFFIVVGERLLRALPPASLPRARLVWLALSAALALALFLNVRPPRAAPLARLLESTALGLFATASLLALFLPVSGLIRARDLRRVLGEVLARWLPFLTYIACVGTLMSATLVTTPLVLDPVLLRMDLSLGFSPSEEIFAWEFGLHWVRLVSQWGYPLLGAFVAAVAATLHLAAPAAHARRGLVALTLVATLGLAAYQLVPAVGPLHAFPALLERPADTPDLRARAADLRRAIIAGPDRIAARTTHPRNVMPSLHTAFTLVALAAAFHWRRKFFWCCLPVGAVQIFTALTLCVHYLVDLFAAVPFAALCWWLADRGVRRSCAPSDTALPALAETPRLTSWFLASLAASLTGFLLWARFAPLSPWLAWPLAGLIAGLPAFAAVRLHRPAVPASATAPPRSPSSPPSVSPSHRLLAIAVFCSGGVALGLEQIYEKYLSTLLGASRPATTIVLAVYFTGLALGAWLCPKQTEGAPRRLALLELFIAAWAALVGVAFFACDRVLGGWLAAAGSSAWGLAAARAAVAAFWILPPALAMGAQLPTLAAVLAGHERWRGHRLARYYALNLAGAFVFTVLTPPLLFSTVGAEGALWAIAALGAAIGGALWFGLPGSATAPGRSVELRPRAVALPVVPLALAFAAGFAFFALEVVWFHLIGAVCGTSTFSFSTLLAVVLLGLALGGRWAARRSVALAPVLGWLVVALTAGSALWPWVGRCLARVQAVQQFEWFWAGELLKFLAVAVVVLPSATLAGQVFPRLLRGFERSPEGSRAVGALCAANVLGCVAGALAAGFVFIPAFGAERTLLVLTLLVAAAWLGALLAASPRPSFSPSLLLPGIAGLALLLALPPWNRLQLTGGHGVYLRRQLAPDAQLAFFREDFSAGFVTVVTSRQPGRTAPVKTLLQNGKFDADDAGEMPAQIGFALVAALHSPAQERALVIGCGSGQTASVIARLGFAHVDIAELSPAHLAAARGEFGHINAGVLDRPNVAVHLEDGRNHLLRTRARYDVVQIELTSVWFAGATNLYSREFYALARERLTPGGVLVQWVQLHHLTPRELASILATAQTEFPFVSVWRAGGQACLLTSAQPPVFNQAIWEKWRWAPELFDERLITGLGAPAAFTATQLVPAAALPALLARTPTVLNTDRNRWLEFQTPRYALSRRDHRTENLRWLGGAPPMPTAASPISNAAR